jgi:CubicO group peptidase (beta-lactamase class C family)
MISMDNRSITGELNHLFLDLEKQEKFSGVVLITRGEQELFSGAYGYASRAWKVPNTMDTRFDTASITKLFTTVSILQIIERGLLSFETSAIEFLDLQGTRISPEVNIYHLLTHTSGIGDDSEEENGEIYEDLYKSKPNYSIRKTEDFLPQFVHREPNFLPGQGCRYCNCSFVLLGLMLEKATGIPYRDYVRTHIFEKAGMTRSGFFDMTQVNERVAEGCDPIQDADGRITGWKRNIYSFPPIGSPDGGAQVTAGDLDHFLREVRAGSLLSHEMTAALFTPRVDYRVKGDHKIMYGYCLWFEVDRDGKVICCEKEGENPGVSGLIRHFPEQDINVVILSNMESGAWQPIKEIHEMVVDRNI